MRILDTHQHLLYPDRFRYSWTDSIPQLAGKAFRWEDYQAAIAGTGIERTLFMETAPDEPDREAEAQFVCDLDIAGAIVGCRPEREDFAEQIERLRRGKVVGLRRILHDQPDTLSQTDRFAANLRLLEQERWTFDLCVLGRQLPVAIRLARQCPEVQFVLDHCGVPDIAAGALDPWRDHIREIAKLPNVACKISGVSAYCRPDAVIAAAVRPYVEHCLDQFGWDRVVWGSDWPVCLLTTTLRQWVEMALELTASASASDREKLFWQNAHRIYGLTE